MPGATLANGSRSGEAVSAYQKALELKPNYMRAWANMGISQANLGNYDASARFYVRALGLNARSVQRKRHSSSISDPLQSGQPRQLGRLRLLLCPR